MKYYYEYPRAISAIQLYYRLLYPNVGLHITIRYLFEKDPSWNRTQRYIQLKNPFVDCGNLANIIRLKDNGLYSMLLHEVSCCYAIQNGQFTIAKWILHYQSWDSKVRLYYFERVFGAICHEGHKELAKACLPTYDHTPLTLQTITGGFFNATRSNRRFFKWLYNIYKDHLTIDFCEHLFWLAIRCEKPDIAEFIRSANNADWVVKEEDKIYVRIPPSRKFV